LLYLTNDSAVVTSIIIIIIIIIITIIIIIIEIVHEVHIHANKNSYAVYRLVPFSMTLSDP